MIFNILNIIHNFLFIILTLLRLVACITIPPFNIIQLFYRILKYSPSFPHFNFIPTNFIAFIFNCLYFAGNPLGSKLLFHESNSFQDTLYFFSVELFSPLWLYLKIKTTASSYLVKHTFSYFPLILALQMSMASSSFHKMYHKHS